LRISIIVIGIFLLVLVGIAIAFMRPGQRLTLNLIGEMVVPAQFALSLFCGAVLVACILVVVGWRWGNGWWARIESLVKSLTLEAVLAASILALSITAVALGYVSLPRAVPIAAFVVTAIVTALKAAKALDSEYFEFETSWGGLGGGLGGWRLSRVTVLVLIAIVFAGAAVATILPSSERSTDLAARREPTAGAEVTVRIPSSGKGESIDKPETRSKENHEKLPSADSVTPAEQRSHSVP
jgi:hypothetical protein